MRVIGRSVTMIDTVYRGARVSTAAAETAGTAIRLG